jgi:RNA polymerase sigma factor (sigma-70 family)
MGWPRGGLVNAADILAAVREGDIDRFGELVEEYLDAIFRFHLRQTGNRSTAEDLTQETFIAAHRSLPKLADPARFRAWLYGIARHQALNYITRAAPRQFLLLDPAVLSRQAAPAPERSRMEANELAEAIDAAIAALSEDLRTPLLMVVIDQLSYEEVADALEVPLGTVKSRIARARCRLTTALKGKGAGRIA